MSRLSSLKSFELRLKALLRWSRPRAGTIIAVGISGLSLVISGITLYLQFLPEYDTTATILQISAEPVNGSDEQHVSVEIAIWNRGHTPAVISGGYLLFDACRDLREGQADYVLAEPAVPLVIPPGGVVLRTVEAYVILSFASGPESTSYLYSGNGKSESELVLGSDCGAGAQAPKRVYIGVGLEAVQSDGKVENSSGLGGLLQRDSPTSALNLKDKYGSIGGTALSHAILWDGEVPKYIEPFSVIPAQHALSTSD